MSNQVSTWYPEIMYEEESKIPFVPIPEGKEMPAVLFMFESRETGEFEPDSEGEPLPIIQMDLHQYANMGTLKERLDENVFDDIRMCLGLEPLKIAEQKGKKVSDNVRQAANKL